MQRFFVRNHRPSHQGPLCRPTDTAAPFISSAFQVLHFNNTLIQTSFLNAPHLHLKWLHSADNEKQVFPLNAIIFGECRELEVQPVGRNSFGLNGTVCAPHSGPKHEGSPITPSVEARSSLTLLQLLELFTLLCSASSTSTMSCSSFPPPWLLGSIDDNPLLKINNFGSCPPLSSVKCWRTQAAHTGTVDVPICNLHDTCTKQDKGMKRWHFLSFALWQHNMTFFWLLTIL